MLRIAVAASLSLIATTLSAAHKKPSDLTLRDLSGKKVPLRDYRGKIVLLNFWATWCVPCREEMPMLVEVEKTWAAKDVTFIAISLDDNKTVKNIAAFLDENGVVFSRVLGEIHRPELVERLAWLTGDRKSAPPSAVVHHM